MTGTLHKSGLTCYHQRRGISALFKNIGVFIARGRILCDRMGGDAPPSPASGLAAHDLGRCPAGRGKASARSQAERAAHHAARAVSAPPRTRHRARRAGGRRVAAPAGVPRGPPGARDLARSRRLPDRRAQRPRDAARAGGRGRRPGRARARHARLPDRRRAPPEPGDRPSRPGVFGPLPRPDPGVAARRTPRARSAAGAGSDVHAADLAAQGRRATTGPPPATAPATVRISW